MTQPALAPLPSHRNDPPSSHLAASRHRNRAATNATLVLAALRQHPGSTGAELAEHLPFDKYETRRRLSDLRRDGKADRPGVRQCEVAKAWSSVWWAK